MSFWKNLINIFNLFPSSKNYNQLSNELDQNMQKLYDDMGWGKYNNPLASTYILGPDMKLVSLEEDMKDNICSESVDIDGTNITITANKDLINQIFKQS